MRAAPPLASVLLLALTFGLSAPAARAAEARHEEGSFVPIETLTATVIAPNGRRAVMTVQSGLDAPDPALRALAQQVQPRLRDAYAQVLQGYAGGLPPGAPPDPDYLGRRLQDATDRVLGRRGARFLFGGIMVN